MSEETAMLCDWLSSSWDWLSTAYTGNTTTRESGSTTIRNLVLAIAAVVALPLAIWRSKIAERQASIAQQDLLNGRYQKGAEMLGSDVLSARLGGAFALDQLAGEHPEQYHLQIMRLFCAFVRHPSGKAKSAVTPLGEEPSTPEAEFDEGWQEGALTGAQQPPVREDVQAILDLIRKRTDKRIDLEKKYAFISDMRGAYLRHASLTRTRLDCAAFTNADLSYAKLTEVSLQKAILRETRLCGAVLGGANLSGATMVGAELSDATLENANLSGVRFSNPGSTETVQGLTQTQLDRAYADRANPPILEGAIDATTGDQLTWRNGE